MLASTMSIAILAVFDQVFVKCVHKYTTYVRTIILIKENNDFIATKYGGANFLDRCGHVAVAFLYDDIGRYHCRDRRIRLVSGLRLQGVKKNY